MCFFVASDVLKTMGVQQRSSLQQADLLNVRMDHFAKTQDRLGRDEGMKWQGKQAVKQRPVDLASFLAHFGRILFEGAVWRHCCHCWSTQPAWLCSMWCLRG